MTNGIDEFCRQLRELGFEPLIVSPNWATIPYDIPAGRFVGKSIKLGFEVPPEFPRTPPHGPHFSPSFFPINPSVMNHPDRVHPSGLGVDWGHWSRTITNWRGKEGAAGYLAFVARLFETA